MRNPIRFSRKLNEYFKENIKLSLVSIRNVIIVTKSDKFYEFDIMFFNTNKNLLTAFRNETENKLLIENCIVDILCNKSIVDIKVGGLHFIARTSDGKVYCWGRNVAGSLGNGKREKILELVFKPELNSFLSDKVVIDIQCGYEHTLALTSEGHVYGWGGNKMGQIGNGSDENCVLIPTYIIGFNEEKVKAISCGYGHSMALTESGRVFGFGSDFDGELGLQKSIKSFKTPQLIDIDNLVFEKICCGYSYSLLLSCEGDIYYSGNMGLDNMEYQSKFIKFMHSEKFSDIATHYNVCFDSISCAQSKNGTFYVWGDVGKGSDFEILTEPKKCNFESFHEIFSHYFNITHKAIEGPVIELFDDIFTLKGLYENMFKNEQYIGKGSYGRVYKANDEFNACYAIKKIIINNYDELKIIRQLKELDVCSNISNLSNQAIVKYYYVWLQNYYIENGVRVEKFCLFIQMDLCDKNLRQLIDEIDDDSNLRQNDSLTLPGYYFVIEIFIQILEGLYYLHKHGIIHRDLKPDNIMILNRQNFVTFVKIGDYGLATIHEYSKNAFSEKSNQKLINDEKQSHTTNIGDINYAAPEVLDGKVYDTKADIYSLGRVLLDLFSMDKKSYESDDDYRKEIMENMPQYLDVIRLWDNMLFENPNDRPDCEEIICKVLELMLSKYESNAQNELEKVFNYYGNKYSYVSELLKKAFEALIIRSNGSDKYYLLTMKVIKI